MKVGIAVASSPRHLAAVQQRTPLRLSRLAGLLLAAGMPVAFWTTLIWAFAKAFGLLLDPAALALAGAAIGACCLVGAAAAMVGPRADA